MKHINFPTLNDLQQLKRINAIEESEKEEYLIKKLNNEFDTDLNNFLIETGNEIKSYAIGSKEEYTLFLDDKLINKYRKIKKRKEILKICENFMVQYGYQVTNMYGIYLVVYLKEKSKRYMKFSKILNFIKYELKYAMFVVGYPRYYF